MLELKITSPADLDNYRADIVHYTDIDLSGKILALPQAQKDKFFKMMDTYPAIIEQLLPPGVDILEHIQGKRFAAANASPHPGIDFSYDDPIIKEYDIWKAKQV